MTTSSDHGNTKTTSMRMSLVAALILIFSGGFLLATFMMQHPQHLSLQKSHVHDDIMGEDNFRLSLHDGHDDDDNDDDDDDDDAIVKDHRRKLGKKADALQLQVDELTYKNNVLKSRVSNLDKQSNHLKVIIRDKDVVISDKDDVISGLNNTVSELEVRVSELEEHASDLEAIIRDKDDVISDLNNTVSELEEQVSNLEDQICTDMIMYKLPEAQCSGVDLSGAKLMHADLTGADLTGANLTGADLHGANLFEADLRFADLSGANLSGVTWINTICPDGSNSKKYNTCRRCIDGTNGIDKNCDTN